MKPIRFSSILAHSQILRASALAAPFVVLTMATAQAGTPTTKPAPAAAPEVASNWIGLTLGGAFVNGDDAGMMQRTRTNGDFFGGISDSHYSKSIDDSTTLTLDGHAIPGLEDYELGMLLNKEGLGYIKFDFDQFRTWYDASGGYLQGANLQGVNAFDDERSIDRGDIGVEFGLRKENLPEVTFSYHHTYREGDKDSTSWGDTRTNAAWGGVAGSNVAFKMMPALWNVDETTDIFELDATHTLGNTDVGLGLVYESYSLDNSRYTPRWGTSPAIGTYAVTMNEQTDGDLFAGNIHSVTRFNDKAWLTFAASYSTLDTDIDGGTRSYAYGPGMTPLTTPARDYSYDAMNGGSNVGTFITNLNFMWVPVQDFTVTPSLRYENETADTYSRFRAYNSTSWVGMESLASNTDMNAMNEALDLRYTGLDNIVIYGKGSWGQENEDIHRGDVFLPNEYLDSKVDVDESEYVLGANWYAMSNLSFSLQGFHSERDQSLDHFESNQAAGAAANPGGANNFRPIMTEHDTEVDDFNLRVTWRPASNLSMVTRYDYRETQYSNAGIAWTAPAAPTFYRIIDSGTVESHILSESVTWTPISRLYLQGNVSWVSSATDTPEVYTQDADNDYLTASLTAGYAIDDRTDVTATYSYYGASNYVNSVGFTGVPTIGYGLNTQEHGISLSLNRMLNDNMLWTLSYAFVTSNTSPMPDQSGGANDFDAQMISTGLQIRF